MKFIHFDKNRHDPRIIADLIYETEPELFSLLFGASRSKALERIKKVLLIGGTSFGYEWIDLAVEEDIIYGLTISYKQGDIDKDIESENLSQALGFFGLLRLWFFDKFLISRLLTKHLKEHELYISNVCVQKSSRGKGVGSFLLKQIASQAKNKGCNSIVLDVSKKNIAAVNLYKKMGFMIEKQRSSVFWKGVILKMRKTIV